MQLSVSRFKRLAMDFMSAFLGSAFYSRGQGNARPVNLRVS